MSAPASAVALMPAELPPVEAGPLMCAGLTTFNALRNSGARPGEVGAVVGLGGRGHLGGQYAGKMGFHTVGIARGKDKEPLARKLGASVYIDSQAQDPAAELLKLGGAKVILATATSGEAMSAVQGGLAGNGTLLIVGAAESMQGSPLFLPAGCPSVKGWDSGTAIDSQDALAFSVRAANGDAAPDVIRFAPNLSGTIALRTGELDVLHDVAINGPGAGRLAVSGSNLSRVVHVEPGAAVSLSGLTITGGNAVKFGGGILNEGALTLTGVNVTGNTASQASAADELFGGAGISNSGTLTI